MSPVCPFISPIVRIEEIDYGYLCESERDEHDWNLNATSRPVRYVHILVSSIPQDQAKSFDVPSMTQR